jgi:hypothetical protein
VEYAFVLGLWFYLVMVGLRLAVPPSEESYYFWGEETSEKTDENSFRI